MKKTVSIILCTYNGERYLREQLDSILAQTYPLYEIIIQDDGSTDGTMDILYDYQKNNPTLIHIYKHKIHDGWNRNFLDAILLAKGDYIACSDQDDIWESNKIERQIDEIGDNWLHVCSSYIWYGDKQIPYYSTPCNLADVFLKYPYCGHQFLFTRDLLPCIQVGIKADMSHDRLLSLVAVYKHKIITSRYLGVHWRRHEGTATEINENKGKEISGFSKIIFTLNAFLRNKKSSVIERAFNKYDIVMTYLDETDGSYPQSKIYLKLFRLLKKQTILSYLKAGTCYIKLRKEVWGDDKISLRKIYMIYTFPFRWWYVQKDNV
ncbi:MAG: glycosyltransferase [Paludibacteraceae bacterium]|nr:glycosyltransferase [Paludibacteraceae bacterium]